MAGYSIVTRQGPRGNGRRVCRLPARPPGVITLPTMDHATTPPHFQRRPATKLLCLTFVLAFAAAPGAAARAQATDDGGTTSPREWNYPSRGPGPGQEKRVDPNG